MKTNIKIPANSTRTRVLSAFMAFLIFTLTFQQAFIGWGGIQTKAASGLSGSSVVTEGTTADRADSLLITGSGGTYTGKFQPSAVTLFDYYSDNELLGLSLASTSDGFYDPYTFLNQAISNDDNGTVSTRYFEIRFTGDSQTLNPKVYFTGGSMTLSMNYNGSYDMTYDPINNDYFYLGDSTVLGGQPATLVIHGIDDHSNEWKTEDLMCPTFGSKCSYSISTANALITVMRYSYTTSNWNSNIYLYSEDATQKNSNWPGTRLTTSVNNKYQYEVNVASLGFDPGWVIFNYPSGGNNNGSWQTSNIHQTFLAGHNYDYSLPKKDSDYNNTSTGYGVTNYVRVSPTTDTLYACKYPTPLYFGAFVRDNDLQSDKYHSYNKASYQNFYWKSNICQRTSHDDTTSAVQHLINTRLNNGQIAQGGLENPVNLPYFDTSWSENYYTYHDNATNTDVTKPIIQSYDVPRFPLYEVKFPDSSVANRQGSAAGGYAKYYQFNAKETNVYYDKPDDGSSNGSFSETATTIHAQRGQGGFFPFNSEDSASGVNNNLGFGAKFTIPFTLTSNGRTETVDSNNTGTGNTVPMMFEFKGDDDVWVFIDDKLVLDLGGSHGATYGYIDFANDSVVATKTVDFATGDKDALNLTGTQSTNTVLDKLNGTNIKSGSTVTYDTSTQHTLTMFYMERGMFESNMLVRYNFNAVPNENTLKICEVTDFSGVNIGLLDLTKKAADNDVFKYTVSNSGTINSDVSTSGILAPTVDTYTRNNGTDYSTKLSGQTSIEDTAHVYLDVSTNIPIKNYFWGKDGAKIAAFLNNGGTSGTTIWGEPTTIDYLYKFPLTIGETTYTHMKFKRFASTAADDLLPCDGEYSGTVWGTLSDRQVTGGKTYIVYYDTSNGYYAKTDNSAPKRYIEVDPPTSHNYDPDHIEAVGGGYKAVATTNYLWTDALAEKTSGTDNKPLANTTDANGNFYLMYGYKDDASSDAVPSSAEFNYQFKQGSTMKVIQENSVDDTTLLSKPTVSGTNPATFGEGTRKFSDYYTTTTPTVVDGDGANVTVNDDGTFIYNHATPGTSVSLTETFVNRVITGQIEIEKKVQRDYNDGNGYVDEDTSANTDVFKMKLQLTDIFGTDIDLDDDAYGNITISGAYTSDGLGTADTLESDGTFYMRAGENQKVTISGIPIRTKFKISEASTAGYNFREIKYDNDDAVSVLTGDPKTLTSTDGSTIVVTNARKIIDVTVTKTSTDNGDKSNGEMDLYYKEVIPPTARSINEPSVVPNPVKGYELTNDTEPTAPAVKSITKETTITTYTYEYTAEENLPSVEEGDWILPRSDNDYIYFRDYNAGSNMAYGDYKSFEHPEDNNTSAVQDKKRSWLRTDLKYNDEGQKLEIDYDHRYWYAAVFTDSTGVKPEQKYSMWERFVDKYNGMDTVVWKIQPPDGYDKVEFRLYDGGNCIRNTKKISFQLGDIFHKTDWGTEYKYQYGTDCYYLVPIAKEASWALHHSGSDDDGRMLWSSMQAATQMDQAVRYTPTNQKITFHCNSDVVWHNIHIEFFTDGTSTNYDFSETTGTGASAVKKYYKYVGQPFPGYMMEPYAYAGDNYRVGNYLTYELTIPKEAKYFRVNNGIDNTSGEANKGTFTIAAASQSPYAYRSTVTELNKTSTNVKNYDNYFSIEGDDGVNNAGKTVTNAAAVTLGVWNNTPSADDRSKTYSDNTVDSDYDYIYFEAPENWGNNIYAYFYAGGDLRDDNWQRAVYSIWPGVAPTETLFTAANANTSSRGDSNIYSYPTGTGSILNPDSYFTDTDENRVYKFRVPKGERKNYNKVIFNNGLRSGGTSGRTLYETSVITYHRGYLYKMNGDSVQTVQHFENKPTTQYTSRGDNLYIKIPSSDTTWDDPHVIFYNAGGAQILQGGKGYLMKFSGLKGDYNYYVIPIPADAKKFSLNNGNTYSNNTGSAQKATAQYDILRYAPTETSTDLSDYTKGDMVYTLNPTANTNTLTKASPTITSHEHNDLRSSGYTPTKQSPRGDYIYIKDTAGVLDAVPTITFYSNSTTATTEQPTALQLVDDSDNVKWYCVGIPTDAKYFTIGTDTITDTTKYAVYTKVSSGTTVNNTSGFTQGDMYYSTSSATAPILDTPAYWPTFTNNSDDLTKEYYSTETNHGQRGDNLYVVNNSEMTNPKVVFYDSEGVPITNIYSSSDIPLKALGENPAGVSSETGYWYSAAIPTNAASFKVKYNGSTTTEQQPIYEMTGKISRYKDNYTPADMQYRISNTSAMIIYPKFTVVDAATLTIGGQTISSESGAQRVDASKVSSYTTPATATVTNSEPTPNQALYQTDSNNISYSWTVGTETPGYWDDDKIYFKNNTGWNADKIYARFSGDGLTTTVVKMTATGSDNKYSCVIPYSNLQSSYDVVFFTADSADYDSQTAKTYGLTLSSEPYGYGQTFKPTVSSKIVFKVTSKQTGTNGQFYAHFYTPELDGYASPYQEWGNGQYAGTPHTDASGYFEWDVPAGNYTKVIFYRYDYENAPGNWSTPEYTLSADDNYGKGKFYRYSTSQSKVVEDTPTGNTDGFVSPYDGSWEGGATWVPGTSATTVSATYQPEDRYGMISNDNSGTNPVTKGDADANNYIYINTADSDPYIMFYSDADGTDGHEIGGSSMATTGFSLKKAKLNGDTSTAENTSPYKVRLPKNARSFIVSNGDTTLGSNVIPLYENIATSVTDGGGNSTNVTMNNYHHAGTTFYLNASTGAIDTTAIDGGKILRTGYTAQKSNMTDPLTPRTDSDYIYFTDVNNDWGNTVYAYYYGGEDGEYTAWPGIKATIPSPSNEAQTAYKDNNGKNVFMFQLPTVANGKYPYVIFNTGSANNRKVTQAIRIMDNAETAYNAAGNNYSVNGTAQHYGTYNSTAGNYVNAYPTKSTSKNSNPTVSYANSDKYIYIINNGTYGFDKSDDMTDSRYILDDMHVVFYDAGGSIIGNAAPGYKPDKVGTKNGSDVYRISIPSGASTFQINNGAGKGSASDTHNHYRRSEIKSITPNGLYKFVTETETKKVWNSSTAPASVSHLNDHLYYLTLDNKDTTPTDDVPPETETTDVKLATIVTDMDGSQKYIKWLKDDGAVDTKYLNHTSSDVGEHAPNGTTDTGVKTVKVVKLGDYYWVESKAPEGYKINTTPTQFTITGDETTTVSSEIEDEPLPKGSLTLTKTAYGAEATDSFTFTITLSNTDVTWSRYTLTESFSSGATSNGASSTSSPATNPTTWNVTLKSGQSFTIDDIPLGTTYAVSETGTLTGWKTMYKVNGGSAATGQAIPDGCTITEKDNQDNGNTVEFINRNEKEPEPEGEVILTKTAKEKVGTIDIGAPLAGAKFLLYKSDGTQTGLTFSESTQTGSKAYTYGLGSFNTGTNYLETGEDGKLHIKGLPYGDYYLEEIVAPNGFSNKDSNSVVNGVAQNKKIYFSVGANRAVKEISATDEMAPAYIKLYEHINEKRDEWGDPTFVFKIKQTGYYAWSTAATPTWEYTTTDSGKEILVALTVDDNKNITNVVKWFNPTGINFDADKIDNTTYGDWLVEGTTDLEDYQGIFDIDSKGRIRVEPGSYEITRVPVSRYEFVTNGKTAAYDNDTLPPDWTEYTVNGNKSEKLKIGEDNNGTMVGLLEPGKTIDVHYYDKVGYYDKFSQVDEEINKFYTLDENTKANKTIKGIRIADYHQVGTETIGSTAADTVEVTDNTTNPATTTQTMTVPVGNLKIFKIMSDGSEVEMTSAEKAALTNFNITYTYDSNSGDKREFGGKAAEGADPAVPAQFSYNTSDKQIVVTDAADFQNGVYTLKAKYKTDANTEFTTTFDLVFLRSST